MICAWNQNGSPLRNHGTDFRMYKSSSLYFSETYFLLNYDKDRLDKVDIFKLKRLMEGFVIQKKNPETFGLRVFVRLVGIQRGLDGMVCG